MINNYDTPTELELFTGGKTPEFTIYFNIALTRMAGLLNYYLNKDKVFEKNRKSLEDIYFKWIEEKTKGNDTLSEKAYTDICNYLWKAYSLRKNSDGYVINQHDKDMAAGMMIKLEVIRNFHSHAYHDNEALVFDTPLKRFIEGLHKDAKLATSMQFPRELEKYEDKSKHDKIFSKHEALFDTRDGKHYITQEGRTFFLSFFLAKGEMTKLLQQRKGSKRNDKPEFKVKHYIYQYYTHRDGASRRWLGVEDNFLSSLPGEAKKLILNTRQAYKVLSYLNDIPALSNDTTLIPLTLKNGGIVNTVNQLIEFCREFDFLTDIPMQVAVKEIPANKNNPEATEKILEHFVELEYKGTKIHISNNSLQKLILDGIRLEKGDTQIRAMFDTFAGEREKPIEWLNMGAKNRVIALEDPDIRAQYEEYYRYRLRADDKLRGKLGKWIDGKINTKELNELQEGVKEAPIEVNYYDFSFGQNSKPRNEDKFVLFAVQYLMDFDLTGWEWGFKKIGPTGKEERKTEYFPQKPEGYRIAIKENQVLLRYNGRVFLLGPSTLRNMLIFIFYEPKSDEQFKQYCGKLKRFFDNICVDINTIESSLANNTTPEKLRLLTENEIPSYMHNNAAANIEKEKLKAANACIKRIETLIKETLTPIVEKKAPTMSRAEKNRQIIRCYRFFDWQYPNNNEFKFLRRDEYNKMSILHYCLKTTDRISNYKQYEFLIKDILPHIPVEITDTLQVAKDIDDLLERIAGMTIKKLREKIKKLNSPIPFNYKAEILKKLSVSLPGKPFTAQPTLPFDIHPILVLRAFYKEELEKGNFSLSFNKLRKNGLPEGLKPGNYNYEAYNTILKNNPESSKILKKVKGKFDRLITEDAILCLIADKYLNEADPRYRDIMKKSIEVGENLRKQEITYPLDENISIRLKFHQLDDYLLMDSKETMLNTAHHLLKRNLEDEGIIQKAENKYEITLEALHKETGRIFNSALWWAKHLMEWEKQVVKAIDLADIISLEKMNSGTRRIGFNQVLEKTGHLPDKLKDEILKVRNKSFHTEIPESGQFTYMELEDETNPKFADLRKLLKYEPKENGKQGKKN